MDNVLRVLYKVFCIDVFILDSLCIVLDLIVIICFCVLIYLKMGYKEGKKDD